MLVAKDQSLGKSIMSQVFTLDLNYNKFYSMKKKSEARGALVTFVTSAMDGANKLIEGDL